MGAPDSVQRVAGCGGQERRCEAPRKGQVPPRDQVEHRQLYRHVWRDACACTLSIIRCAHAHSILLCNLQAIQGIKGNRHCSTSLCSSVPVGSYTCNVASSSMTTGSKAQCMKVRMQQRHRCTHTLMHLCRHLAWRRPGRGRRRRRSPRAAARARPRAGCARPGPPPAAGAACPAGTSPAHSRPQNPESDPNVSGYNTCATHLLRHLGASHRFPRNIRPTQSRVTVTTTSNIWYSGTQSSQLLPFVPLRGSREKVIANTCARPLTQTLKCSIEEIGVTQAPNQCGSKQILIW